MVCPDMFQRAQDKLPFDSVSHKYYPWSNSENMFHGMEGLFSLGIDLTHSELQFIKTQLQECAYINPRPCWYPFLFVLLVLVIPLVGIILSILLLAKHVVWMILLIVFFIVLAVVSYYCLSQSYKTRLLKRETELGFKMKQFNDMMMIARGAALRVGPFGSWLEAIINTNKEGRPLQYNGVIYTAKIK